VVGYHRYDTAPELLLLNEIWQLLTCSQFPGRLVLGVHAAVLVVV
jgi:hypothetical protein